MGRLVPADFDLTSLPMSEQRVARSMLDRLGDEWLVVPHVPIRKSGTDGEIDLVVVSPTRGVTVIEVKGGVIAVVAGQWRRYGKGIANPFAQVTSAKHALVRYLRSVGVDTSSLWVEHMVALPDVASVPEEGLGPDARRDQVLTAVDLEDPEPAICRVQRPVAPLCAAAIDALVRALRPDIQLSSAAGTYFDSVRTRLDAATLDGLGVARSLDANRRVLVDGGAGTGKSWLVVDWARRAARRGERTAVVCFNRPIADRLANLLRSTDGVTVDSYHGLVVSLLEPFGFEVPSDPNPQWWRKVPTEELRRRRREVGTPFDTIVVDEAQDLRPKWLDSLRSLLDPGGADRLLMVLDRGQAIYPAKWHDVEEFSRASLGVNLRSSRAIAEFCRRLGGAEPLAGAPDGRPPAHTSVRGRKELRKHVERAVAALLAADVAPREVAVLTTRRQERDHLLGELGAVAGGDRPGARLTRWEDRDADTVVCETVHRAKGLECDAVVLATLDDPVDPQLLYVGASRARMHLDLIGPASLAGATAGAGQGAETAAGGSTTPQP